MKSLYPSSILAAIASLAVTSHPTLADTFGSGANRFEIEFVTIGDPGNPADALGDPNAAGSVSYAYRIGKYEISRDMFEKANLEGDLGITLQDMSAEVDGLDMLGWGGNGPNQPATGVDWFEAATFVNWLNSSSGHPAAYKFSEGNFELWQPGDAGYNADNLFRNSLAFYFLPSADEWYKAAFYDPQAGSYYEFPTGSNTPPTPVAEGTIPGTAVYMQDGHTGPAEIMQAGGLSPYGTMAQGGNIIEWEETEYDFINDDPSMDAFRGKQAGRWFDSSSYLFARSSRQDDAPGFPDYANGFRVASVSIPEPGGLLLAIMAGLGLWLIRSQQPIADSAFRASE